MCFRTTVLACAVLVASLAFASAANAHAALKSVTPADRATLTTVPKSIVIEFTKDVSERVEEATLLPPSGKPIKDSWDAAGTRITISPPSTMANGTWGVEWRVIGGDGHPLTGSTTFVVASKSAPAPPDAETPPAESGAGGDVTTEPSRDAHAGHVMASSYPHDALERLALGGRILFFGGLLLFVGGVLFAVLAAPGWLPRFWSSTLLAAIVGAWLVLGTHAAMLEERSVLQMLNPLVWFSDMVSVGVRGYVLAGVLLVLVHVFRWQLEPAEWEAREAVKPRLLLALVLAAAAAPSLSGHAADGTYLWLRVPLDMLHVLAGAAWLGGLVQVLTIARRERSRDPRMFRVINRYSKVAATSVGVLVVTGIFATFNELDAGIGELVGSTWGQLILAKVLLLAATMPLANANRLRNVPDLTRDPTRGLLRLRRFVALELLIIVWVVGATAMLVYETPPQAGASEHMSSHG